MTTAVHLAAGRGSRLRPLTDDKPKPLVELAGRSLLERNVETLERAGVDRQIVVTGYKAAAIEEKGYETVHNEKHAETEMVYSLFCAEPAFSAEEDLLISYGDIVYDDSVAAAILDNNGEVSVVVDCDWRSLWDARFDNPLEDAESLQIENGRITSIGKEDTSYDDIEAQYIGLVKVRGDRLTDFVDAYRAMGGDDAKIHMTRFLQRLIDAGWNIEAVPIENGWVEVDTLQDLKLYRTLAENGELKRFIQLASSYSIY